MKILSIKNSIVLKLTTMFILIIIPTFIFSFIINNVGRKLISDNIIGNVSSVSNKLLQTLDKEFVRVYDIQMQIVTNASLSSELQSTLSLSDYESLKQLIDIRDTINILAKSSEYIKDVRLHLPAINKTISFSKGISPMTTSEFEYFKDKDNKTLSKYKQGLYATPDSLYSVLFNASYSLKTSSAPKAICVVEISNDSLLSNMNVFSKEFNGHYFLSSYDNVFYIADNVSSDKALLQLQNFAPENNQFTKKIDGVNHLIITRYSEDLNLKYVCYVSQKDVFSDISKYQSYLLAFSLGIFLLLIIYLIITYKSIFSPIKTLVNGFNKAENGDFSVQLTRKDYDEFGYLYSSFNHMVKKIDNLIDKEYRDQIAIQNSRLKQLQSQINPHFLYNSFFILKRRISSCDYENAEVFAEYLGEYFKFITKESSDYITLGAEFEHALTYVKIQSVRFKNKITVTSDNLEEQYKTIIVPRLILQPIVENAFVHGFEKSNRAGEIKITIDDTGISGDDSNLVISIANTSALLDINDIEKLNIYMNGDNAWDNEISGLANISWRLKLLYGNGYQLKSSYDDGFFMITIKIPKEK